MKTDITTVIRQGGKLSAGAKINIVLTLSAPAIISRLASIVMQYIDAAMVGALGAEASAAVGLDASTTWMFEGVTMAAVFGYTVQIANEVGAGRTDNSARIYAKGLRDLIAFSAVMTVLGLLLSLKLPELLGADASIADEARIYFAGRMIFMPVAEMMWYSANALQSTGNMKTPGIMQSLACLLDVVFNYFLIFPARAVTIGGFAFTMPGAGLGVLGAAIGTGLAEAVAAAAMLYIAGRRTPALAKENFEAGNSGVAESASQKNDLQGRDITRKSVRIAWPLCLEQLALSSAMVVTTAIVAPLGNIAIAANSFAITAESICYMPGYGIESAATTLVGQSRGAGRPDLSKSFAWISIMTGVLIMTVTGALMYVFCPAVFAFLTPVEEIRQLGASVLRIQLLAEPLFGASIVAMGALRGAEDTLVPSVMTLVSIWGVRVTLAAVLVGRYGLYGVWTAMCIELVFRGVIFLIRTLRFKWQ